MIKEIMLASALSFTTMNYDNTHNYLNLTATDYQIGFVDVYEFLPLSDYSFDELNCFLIRPFDNFSIGMAHYNVNNQVIESYEEHFYEYGDDFPFAHYLLTDYNEHLTDYRLNFVINSNSFFYDNPEDETIYITYMAFDEGDNLLVMDSESYNLALNDNGDIYLYPYIDFTFLYNITTSNNVNGVYSQAFMFTTSPITEDDDVEWFERVWNGSYFETFDIWSYTDNMYYANQTINGETTRINLMEDLIFTNNDLNNLYNDFNTRFNELTNQYNETLNSLTSQYQTQIDALTRDLNDLLSDYHILELDYERVLLENEQLNSKFVFNNTFDLLSKAVESVSSFLNIEIAPNITIGMVITIPIVVAVVLFVLKGLIQ